jgi:uncharacterized protein YndB with AHSA1/START domain
MIPNIRKELLVAAPQQTCFVVFTQKMDAWWPKTHHVGKCPMIEMLLEPAQGGRWYSKHEDGSEVTVGHVLTWNPYDLLVLNWQIDANFQCDPGIVSEVEVQFIAEGPKSTRVRMEHKNLDRLGQGAKAIESMDDGWGMILNLYKNTAEYEA